MEGRYMELLSTAVSVLLCKRHLWGVGLLLLTA